MQGKMQHLCSKIVDVEWFECRGEIILDIHDPETGEQIEACPECGWEILPEQLFSLDIFPEIQLIAEMAEV